MQRSATLLSSVLAVLAVTVIIGATHRATADESTTLIDADLVASVTPATRPVVTTKRAVVAPEVAPAPSSSPETKADGACHEPVGETADGVFCTAGGYHWVGCCGNGHGRYYNSKLKRGKCCGGCAI